MCTCERFTDVFSMGMLKLAVTIVCGEHHNPGHKDWGKDISQTDYRQWALEAVSSNYAGAWGMFCSGMHEIFVCGSPTLTEEMRWQTFLHELGHASARVMDNDFSEERANAMAVLYAELLRPRGTLAEWLSTRKSL